MVYDSLCQCWSWIFTLNLIDRLGCLLKLCMKLKILGGMMECGVGFFFFYVWSFEGYYGETDIVGLSFFFFFCWFCKPWWFTVPSNWISFYFIIWTVLVLRLKCKQYIFPCWTCFFFFFCHSVSSLMIQRHYCCMWFMLLSL